MELAQNEPEGPMRDRAITDVYRRDPRLFEKLYKRDIEYAMEAAKAKEGPKDG